jgi:2-polyprenyl-3-methyl-5-hydroxy-6-metoxy-1,4-benzoquinol methylase
VRRDVQREYTFEDDTGENSHSYLLPGIRAALAAQICAQGYRDKILVDMGCGNGAMLGTLRGFKRRIGLEMSESGLAIARVAHPDVDFRQIDLCSPIQEPDLSGIADVVISTEVIEHVFLPREFVANARGILRTGGLLVVSTPYHGYLKNLAIAVLGGCDKHWMPLWDYGHIKFWSRKTLTILLEEHGFDVVAFRGVGRIPFLWKSMIVSAVKR